MTRLTAVQDPNGGEWWAKHPLYGEQRNFPTRNEAEAFIDGYEAGCEHAVEALRDLLDEM